MIDGVTEELSFLVVDYQSGTLRVQFCETNNAAVAALLRRLEEEMG